MYNLSFSTVIVPKNWKIAKITPIRKQGDHTNMNNLRPIALLPLPGKILGPTFYLIYVNDIEVSLRNSKVQLYADDTVMYVSAPSLNHACTLLQPDLDKLSNWCEKNQLTVNTSKTKAMLFGMRHVIKSTPPLTLVLNDEKLQFVESYKYLDATLDNLLDFELHAKTTFKLVSHKIRIFSKIRGYLNESQALTVYKTKILPYFDYADILCIGSYQRTPKKLQKQQNQALRICLRLGSRSKVNVLHKMGKIELLSDRRNSHLLNFMCKRKESPQYVNNAEAKTRLFDAIVLNEARITRTSVERSGYCKGARAWDSLPPTERNLPCHELFKHHQKRNVKEMTKNLPVS